MRKGTLYVFTGPSGAGKGTVLGRLLAEDDRLFFSISATTRAPRPGEQNGVHYYFLEKTENGGYRYLPLPEGKLQSELIHDYGPGRGAGQRKARRGL